MESPAPTNSSEEKETRPWMPSLVSALASGCFGEHTFCMTLRVLEREVLELPPRSRVRLAEKIIESIGDYDDPELKKDWENEIERRVKEIESGSEKGIPAEQVMKEARRALNETRRLPSARRK